MLKKKYIEPLISVSKNMLNTMAQVKVKEVEKIKIIEDTKIDENMYISIGVTGDLKGNIFLIINSKVIKEIAGNMMGMPQEEVNDLVISAIEELTNIIGGNYLTELAEENNCNCDLTVPTVTKGDNLNISSGNNKYLKTSLNTNIGKIKIKMKLKEK